MNEINDDEIIININEANKAQKYKNKNELFQIEAFERVTEILQEHSHGNDTDNIVDCRFHDTIFIDGDRGVGKTAFMLNIERFYNKFSIELDEENKNNLFENTKKNKYVFLNPIDPTLLEHTERFLSVVLARVVEKVNDSINNNQIDEQELDSYYESLEKLSKSLSAIKTLDDDLGIEEIASSKSSLKLEQHSHEFFKAVCKLSYTSHALVILIDDVDMAFDKGFDVLEVVRKYLASPYIIPIVAGDMKLYREIIETRFMDKIEFSNDIKNLKAVSLSKESIKDSSEYKKKISLLNNLVEQYLHKLFPSENYIKLDNIFYILKNKYVTIKYSKDFRISYNDIKDFEIRFINFGINQIDFTFQVFTDNTRDLVQYIYNKRKVYKDFFETLKNYKFVKSKDIVYSVENISKKLDFHIMNKLFCTPNKLYKESLNKTFLFYRFSNDRKKQELSMLIKNDYDSFEDNNYHIYKVFSSETFKNFEKFKNIEQSVKNYSIKSSSLSESIKANENDEESEYYFNLSKYVTDLFIFNDYYSSYQTRNYLMTGNFLEMIFYSFDINSSFKVDSIHIGYINQIINNSLKKNLDLNTTENPLIVNIYNLLYSPSKNSDFNKLEENHSITKYFNNIEIDNINSISKSLKNISKKVPIGSEFISNNRYKEESTSQEENDYLVDNNYDLKDEVSIPIVIWNKVFCQNIKLNTISLYEIIFKFFKNIEKIKWTEGKELEDNNPVLFLRRIVLVLINSVAFFEKQDSDVANINIAIKKDFNLNNTLTKNQASLKNIIPMLKTENSITRALFFHPIISHILFFNSKQKFHNLRFIDSFEIEKFLESIPRYIDGKSFTIDKRIEILEYTIKNINDKENLKMLYNYPKFKSDILNKDVNSKDNEKLSKFKSFKDEIENKIK